MGVTHGCSWLRRPETVRTEVKLELGCPDAITWTNVCIIIPKHHPSPTLPPKMTDKTENSMETNKQSQHQQCLGWRSSSVVKECLMQEVTFAKHDVPISGHVVVREMDERKQKRKRGCALVCLLHA